MRSHHFHCCPAKLLLRHRLRSTADPETVAFLALGRSNDMEVNVAKDKIVTSLDEFHSDIWMMELESGK